MFSWYTQRIFYANQQNINSTCAAFLLSTLSILQCPIQVVELAYEQQNGNINSNWHWQSNRINKNRIVYMQRQSIHIWNVCFQPIEAIAIFYQFSHFPWDANSFMWRALSFFFSCIYKIRLEITWTIIIRSRSTFLLIGCQSHWREYEWWKK